MMKDAEWNRDTMRLKQFPFQWCARCYKLPHGTTHRRGKESNTREVRTATATSVKLNTMFCKDKYYCSLMMMMMIMMEGWQKYTFETYTRHEKNENHDLLFLSCRTKQASFACARLSVDTRMVNSEHVFRLKPRDEFHEKSYRSAGGTTSQATSFSAHWSSTQW